MKIYYKFIKLKSNILFTDIRSVINNNASRGNHIRIGIIKHLFYDIYFYNCLSGYKTNKQ